MTKSLSKKVGSFLINKNKMEVIIMKKWTKQTAQEYIKTAKQKGLTYWSAIDYLNHHKTIYSII